MNKELFRRAPRRDGPEVFLADPDLFLVDGFSVNLGIEQKIGEAAGGPAFFITLAGRTNGEAARKDLHIKLSAELGYKLGDEVMTRMEELVNMLRAQGFGES